jgi:hypothetical protein
MTKLYIVIASRGEWSDRTEWPVWAFKTEAAAQAYIAEKSPKIRAAENEYAAVKHRIFAQDGGPSWSDESEAELKALRPRLDAEVDVPGVSIDSYESVALHYACVELKED